MIQTRLAWEGWISLFVAFCDKCGGVLGAAQHAADALALTECSECGRSCRVTRVVLCEATSTGGGSGWRRHPKPARRTTRSKGKGEHRHG